MATRGRSEMAGVILPAVPTHVPTHAGMGGQPEATAHAASGDLPTLPTRHRTRVCVHAPIARAYVCVCVDLWVGTLSRVGKSLERLMGQGFRGAYPCDHPCFWAQWVGK